MLPPIPASDPPLGGKPIALAPGTYDRVAEAVNYYEQQGRVRTPLGRTYSGGPPIPNQVVYTGSGGVAAATAAGTPSSALATLCTWNGSSWVAGTDTITIWNMSTGGGVTANAYVMVSWVGGIWVVTMDPC
jgi:hypothetical protein